MVKSEIRGCFFYAKIIYGWLQKHKYLKTCIVIKRMKKRNLKAYNFYFILSWLGLSTNQRDLLSTERIGFFVMLARFL